MRHRRSDGSQVGCEIASPAATADGKIIVSPATTEVNFVNPSATADRNFTKPSATAGGRLHQPFRNSGISTSSIGPTAQHLGVFSEIFAAALPNREGNSTFYHCTFLAHRGPLLQLMALIPLCHVPVPQSAKRTRRTSNNSRKNSP